MNVICKQTSIAQGKLKIMINKLCQTNHIFQTIVQAILCTLTAVIILNWNHFEAKIKKGLTFKKLNAELFDEQFCIFFQSAFS